MRVIVRKERPHPGAQLRFTDIDGHRFTCFATSTSGGQLADLELRHRRRARCEDRIRCAKDTGLRNLPLHGYAQNQIWCEIVAMACDLLAWTAMLALDGPARRWEPKRLRLRLFTAAGRIVRGSRRLRLRLAARWPWASTSPPRSPGSRPWPPADQPGRPATRKENQRARGTPPPGATAGPPARTRPSKTATARRPAQASNQDHERSRLMRPGTQLCSQRHHGSGITERFTVHRMHDARVGPLGALDIHSWPGHR